MIEHNTVSQEIVYDTYQDGMGCAFAILIPLVAVLGLCIGVLLKGASL